VDSSPQQILCHQAAESLPGLHTAKSWCQDESKLLTMERKLDEIDSCISKPMKLKTDLREIKPGPNPEAVSYPYLEPLPLSKFGCQHSIRLLLF